MPKQRPVKRTQFREMERRRRLKEERPSGN